MSILEVNHIKKVYKTRMGGDEVTALRDVHFSVEPGEFVAIMGESGSGKTTLLNILASLDTPTAGKVLVDGKDFTTSLICIHIFIVISFPLKLYIFSGIRNPPN